MAKLSKKMLKSVVKECLIEILAEGIGNPDSTSAQLRERRQRDINEVSSRRSQVLDKIQFKKSVDNTVNKITSDPLMASILADTAASTLQEQVEAETYPGMPSTGLDSFGSSGESLESFDDVSRNWATLAFADKDPHKL